MTERPVGLFKTSVPKHCCPYCGEPVGYIGNFFAWLFGLGFHGCKLTNVRGRNEDLY